MTDSISSCGVGFVCNIPGVRSHYIVAKGIEAVMNLTHRGAIGADGKTGDGCGVMFELPRKFFVKEMNRLGISIPHPDRLAVGVFFLYRDGLEPSIEAVIKKHGLLPLGWRDVPVDVEALGTSARLSMPRIRHLFIDMCTYDTRMAEVSLYLARREIETAFGRDVYIPSLSFRTIVYKGMLIAPFLSRFYLDLRDEDIESCFCLFHQRFSTNTSPDWTLAQPFRAIAHNGEINTLMANRNFLAMLEDIISHPIFGARAELIKPLVSNDESDSASLDRVIELMIMAGMRPEHAVTACIPPAWENTDIDRSRQAFFEYHSLLMKPWDGPAAVVFTDGETIGAHMDRNGLRPLRYTLTEDGLMVLGSETGIVNLEGRKIREKGRLGPGETIVINTRTSSIHRTDEIVRNLSSQRPYAEWLNRHLFEIGRSNIGPAEQDDDLIRKQAAFGYTIEDIQTSIKETASTGKETVSSMGDDTPLPPLSERPALLFRYFKQRFSQVTNPPIDPIRERMVMSLRMYLGPCGNFLNPKPEDSRRLGIPSPILTGAGIVKILTQEIFPVKKMPITYAKSGVSLYDAVRKLQKDIVEAVHAGAEIILLSDRDLSRETIAIPSLLAVSASLTALASARSGHRASIIIETGEARDEHHIACLIGFGASAVYPYLAFQTISDLCKKGEISLDYEQAAKNYIQAIESGLLKSIARMGISTVMSYHAGRIFDSVGLKRDFVEEFFPSTPVSIEADGIEEIEASVRARHEAAYAKDPAVIEYGGALRPGRGGEQHAWSREAVAALNRFIKTGEPGQYREYVRIAETRPIYIRHLLGYRTETAIPLNEVEPEEAILKRFVAGAMSIGALSPEAHETIAEACNRLGIKSNSGEGGEDPLRYFGPKNSAIKQVASGRFGVTPTYIASASDIEIKIAQGAKPGEGGHLPALKVTEYIARLRHCAPNTLLISPPPHHDIYSIEDLAQLIHDLKQANPKAHVCVKLVAESGVGTVAAGVAKAYADIVQISGCEGGTGAATISSIKNAGNYWEIGLREAQQALIENGLRERVRLRVDGGLRTGKDVVIAAMLGAEEFGFGTAAMIAAGCVMARVCHANTCPTGIATQDNKLRQRFRGTVDGVMAFFRAVAGEVREILSKMGCRSLSDIIGRPELLIPLRWDGIARAVNINTGELIAPYPDGPRCCTKARNDNPAPSLNNKIVEDILPHIERGEPVSKEYEIRNIDRSIPVRLNYHIALKYGDAGLPQDTIRLTFKGTAGQSFGAFNHKGLFLTLIGEANDYTAKGMFGGRIAIIPLPDGGHGGQVIVGNTVLYGATGGEFYAAGLAGERFGIRNSGAKAVVEGAGLHLCEYMTAGTVVVLGQTGFNIGAGMTGGAIYILDRDDDLLPRLNTSYVSAAQIEEADDIQELKILIEAHLKYTGSPYAKEILSSFDSFVRLFKKVTPHSRGSASL